MQAGRSLDGGTALRSTFTAILFRPGGLGAFGGNEFVERPIGRVASQTEKAIVGIVCAFRRTRPLKTYDKDTNMPSGTVKWFNAQKGYGFIQPSDGGKDVFVHISAVEQAGLSTLNEGQKINFEIVTTDRGRTAAGNLKLG
jgi:CspA family cold shock protein